MKAKGFLSPFTPSRKPSPAFRTFEMAACPAASRRGTREYPMLSLSSSDTRPSTLPRTSPASSPKKITWRVASGSPSMNEVIQRRASIFCRARPRRMRSMISRAAGLWASIWALAASARSTESKWIASEPRAFGRRQMRTLASVMVARVPSEPTRSFARLKGSSLINSSRLYPATRRMIFGYRSSISWRFPFERRWRMRWISPIRDSSASLASSAAPSSGPKLKGSPPARKPDIS